MIATFDALLDAAAGLRVPVAVAGSDSETARAAMALAMDRGIAVPVWVDGRGEDAARAAVARVRAGEARVLLKGALRTDELLRAVLHRDEGLRTGQLLSDVLLYEDRNIGLPRLVGVTDGGITPAPDEEQLRAVVANAVAVFRALGFERPKVALLSATEAVSDSVPSTVRARAVAEWASASLEGCDVAGPFALDNALLPSAAEAKGIAGPVAGRADILVAPSIEAGNLLGKAARYLGGSVTAHVVVGAAAPVLIPSRVESAEDKLHSLALGALLSVQHSAFSDQ